MRTSRAMSLVLAVGLVGSAGDWAFAQAPANEAAVKPPPIEVSVECDENPEVVVIRNNRAKPITVKQVTSTWQTRAGEPYRVKRKLKPGKSVTYTFGTGKGKGARNLSGNFIFDNDELSESVVVNTSKGRVKVKCTTGTNRPPVPPAPVEVEDPVEAPEQAVIGIPVDALDLLAALPVAAEVEEGYARDEFKHWVDADGDGCDTREEVLARESLTPVTKGAGCEIESGSWYSVFDGETLTNPSNLDIGHMVSLAEAWRSGAFAWSPERREAYANDLGDERTLRAISSGANRLQSQSDPAAWLPADREVACAFVRDWVAIKATWGLSVDEVEREAIDTTLAACPDRTVTITPRPADG